MTRILAHNIVYRGVLHRLSVAELDDDATTLRIYPFTQEIASTAWVDGTVTITFCDGKYHFCADNACQSQKKCIPLHR